MGLPVVSVVIPCRNEEGFIGRCLDSILANGYPSDLLEVLVVDGESSDGTRAIVADYAARFSVVHLLPNPRRITPVALNLGVRAAQGQLIMRVDAHGTLGPGYIAGCVRALQTSGADNVGGIMHTVPRTAGLVARAIVASTSHRFGVGGSYFRVHSSQPRWVDTVFGGCYRREVFERVGLFNERLVSTQDLEFNLRLKRAGGRTLLVPDLTCSYYARSDFPSFTRNNFRNGLWVVLPFLYSRIIPVSLRHLVPLCFTLALVGSAVLAALWTPGVWVLAAVVVPYAVADLAASVQVAIGRNEWRLALIMPFIFASLHLAYGLGSLVGLLRVAAGWLVGGRRFVPEPVSGGG